MRFFGLTAEPFTAFMPHPSPKIRLFSRTGQFLGFRRQAQIVALIAQKRAAPFGNAFRMLHHSPSEEAQIVTGCEYDRAPADGRTWRKVNPEAGHPAPAVMEYVR